LFAPCNGVNASLAPVGNVVVTASKSARHIASLDGLRAISFLLVFAAHSGLEKFVPGGLGVTIFFFLSGFLITTLMRAEYEKNGAVNIRHFWLRRALRIWPPFYVVLIAASISTLVFESSGAVSPAAVAAQALHYTNYWIIYHGYAGLPAGTGVYWSLAVEEHFYIVFPWIYVVLQKYKMSCRNQALTLWAMCALVLLWRCVLVFAVGASEDRTYMASDTRVDSILFGCALAVWNNPVLDDVALRERRWKYAYVPVALLTIAVCVLVRNQAFRETLRYSLQGAALTGIFIAAIRFREWLPMRLLNLRPVAFIGVLSYTLYLLHYAVIAAVQWRFSYAHPALQAGLAFSISMGLAWVMYVVIEKPCARLRRKLTD
jgi:peptidoglycan/LPS O-acetylase OafA/YrhL